MKEKYTCVICHRRFAGFENNPQPLKQKGSCCDHCNGKVIAARMKTMQVVPV